MKKIIILLLAVVTINAASAQQQSPVADTVPLLTIKDFQLLRDHLGKNLLGKDYELVLNALTELYGIRVNEYLAAEAKKKEPVKEKTQTPKSK